MSWHHLCTLHILNQAQSHNVAKKGNKALPSDNKILHFNAIEIFIKFCRIVTIFFGFLLYQERHSYAIGNEEKI